MEWIATIEAWIAETIGFSPETQHKIELSIAVVLLATLVRLLALRIVNRNVHNLRVRYRWRKAIGYFAYFLAILVVGRIWISGFSSLTTFLGLLSAGVAIALKDLLTNLAGWLFIIWRRPFSTGDRIEIGAYRGDVIDTRLFQFSVLEVGNWVAADQSTGRIVNIPNGMVFTEPLASYTLGFDYVWDELPVLVTFESNWEKAKQLLVEIVERQSLHFTAEAERQVRSAAAQYMIFFSKFTPIVYTSVEDSGVMLTLRFMTRPRERRGVAEKMWEDVLRTFGECDDIDFAYPTQRFYNNASEGKRGARASLLPDGEPPAPSSAA
ncbi:MAG: mechanosensitive ion channel family protein [Planctomycetota bacterium]|nr:MAG: mechanosensitive ion channel family protein [Planctomycetota bacterium]REJ87604.1 MAG: mechanosensitive ion channel family protein [Planctomycetota bacterium]REK30154.1 MAG: mechanosensitive ion channel family protein [Planctomycetota bacterium]REK43319.1 MAG: mechanosensitive ion channel family protein [Planctomycetota bacterium]